MSLGVKNGQVKVEEPEEERCKSRLREFLCVDYWFWTVEAEVGMDCLCAGYLRVAYFAFAHNEVFLVLNHLSCFFGLDCLESGQHPLVLKVRDGHEDYGMRHKHPVILRKRHLAPLLEQACEDLAPFI
jgi:hypothetical protein